MKITATQRKWLTYGGLGAGLGLVVLGMAVSRDMARPDPARAPVSRSLTGGVDTRVASLDGLANRLGDLENQLSLNGATVADTMAGMAAALDALATRLETLEEDLRQPPPFASPPETRIDAGLEARLEARLAGLERALADLGRTPGGRAPAAAAAEGATARQEANPAADATPARPLPPDEPPEAARAALLYAPVPATRIPDPAPGTSAPAGGPAAPIRTLAPEPPPAPPVAPLRLAATSVVTTWLVTGVDAPTGVRAADHPVPVLMRIKRAAILPNDARADVVDCHFLGAAVGDLAARRVQIRGETVSCTLSDGSIHTSPVRFFATGEDGKAGVPGRLVSRAGEALARTAMAGFGTGIGRALRSTPAPETLTLESLMGSSAAQAGSEAFGKLADYYIALAEQSHPVIEVENGRWIDVVLTADLEITFAAKGMGMGAQDG